MAGVPDGRRHGAGNDGGGGADMSKERTMCKRADRLAWAIVAANWNGLSSLTEDEGAKRSQRRDSILDILCPAYGKAKKARHLASYTKWADRARWAAL